MNPGLEIGQVLDAARRYVLSDPQGHLLWGLRMRLWDRMSAELGDEEAGFRYDVLAYLTARHTAQLWNNAAIPPDCTRPFLQLLEYVPDELLRDHRLAILGEQAARERLVSWREKMRTLHWMDEIPGHRLGSVLIVLMYASGRIQFPDLHFAAYDVYNEWLQELCSGAGLWDDPALLRVDELEEIGDPLFYPLEYWASYAWSVDDEGANDPARRRQFWLMWIEELVPAALRPREEIRALLVDLRP